MNLPSRIQADIDLDAFIFNLNSIKNNIKEETQIITAVSYTHLTLPTILRV